MAKITSISVVVLLAVGGIFLFEKSQQFSDYASYFGNITKELSYNHPENIESVAFIAVHGNKLIRIELIDRLWCKPLRTLQRPQLIATDYRVHDKFSVTTDITGMFAPITNSNNPIIQIGLRDASLIRRAGIKNGYHTELLTNIHPNKSATCFIESEVSVFTKVFSLRKTIEFAANQFDYIIPKNPIILEGDYNHYVEIDTNESSYRIDKH